MTTNPTTPMARKQRSPVFRFLFVHQIDEYPRFPSTNRALGLGGHRHHRLVLHVLHTDRRHPEHPGDVPHVVLLLRLDRHHLERHRRVRFATRQPDRPARTLQRRDLRAAHRGHPRHLRRPGHTHRVGVRHGDLLARSGRRCHPRGHPSPRPRLQPSDRPGVGHGILDARAGGRLARRERRGCPYARPLYERLKPHRLAQPVLLLRHHRTLRVRAVPFLLEGPLLEAARPADGVDERRSSPRSPRPRHFRRRVAEGDPAALGADPQVGPGGFRPWHRAVPSRVLRRQPDFSPFIGPPYSRTPMDQTSRFPRPTD